MVDSNVLIQNFQLCKSAIFLITYQTSQSYNFQKQKDVTMPLFFKVVLCFEPKIVSKVEFTFFAALKQWPLSSLTKHYGLQERQVGHSVYFNTAVTKQDFLKILGVSSQKWCKTISYYHGNMKQTLVYLISPSVLILMKWDVTKQDFFLVLWLNHLQLLSKIIGYYHGNRE